MRAVLATGCEFPWSYTGLHNESRPGEEGALQTECARITARIRYVIKYIGNHNMMLKAIHITS